MPRGTPIKDQVRQAAIAAGASTYESRVACLQCGSRTKFTTTSACHGCRQKRLKEKEASQQISQSERMQYLQDRRVQLEDAARARKEAVEREVMNGGKYTPEGDFIQIRARVDYSGDNSYPDEWPYNLSMRPPMRSGSAYGLQKDFLIW